MSKETKTRILHLMALLGSIAAAVAPAWVDPEQTWPGRIAITIVVALLLGVGTERIKSQRNAILGGLALAGVVVAAILGKFSAGTAGFAFVGGLLAVISQVRTILVKELADGEQPAKVPSVPPAGTAVLILALGLGAASPARADIVLDEIAPKLTKCWDTTCLQPAAAVNAALYDLKAGQWMAGTTSLGAGLELLFFADQTYGSGFIAHLTGVVSQQGPSFAMPTVGVVVFRYAEIGYSYRLQSEGENRHYLSASLTLPWDLVATGKTLPTRAAAARAGKRLTESDF